MSFYRSEEMLLCRLLLHKETAFDCLAELGYLGAVQFNTESDEFLSPNLQYTNEIKRCNDLQRIIEHLQMEIVECGMKIEPYSEVDAEQMPQVSDLKKFELVLHKMEKELVNARTNYNILRVQLSDVREKCNVLGKVESFFGDGRSIASKIASSESRHQLHLSFLIGSIPAERFAPFELMLWRFCHRNFYLKRSDVLEPSPDANQSDVLPQKYAFMVYFVGEKLRQKIIKVCRGFRAILFDCPATSEARQMARKKCATEIEDIKLILERTSEHRRRILIIIANDLFIWKAKLQKMLMIYSLLNRFGRVGELVNKNYLQAECWILADEISSVRSALLRGAKHTSYGDDNITFPPVLSLKEYERKQRKPPTYFRTNKLMHGIQNLVDSYGIASYQELNPAAFSIITFPFLFAVMFGDVGHGALMAIFGICLVLMEKKIDEHNRSNEIWNILFTGRYLIMLMGLFSIYTGLMYNVVFSVSFNLIGSKWRVNFTRTDVLANKKLQLDPARLDHYQGTPHIFGMDPIWGVSAESSMIFLNSFKMKLAIILGVVHMIFGLWLSSWNTAYFDNELDYYLVFMPKIVFFCCLFGYLAFLIMYKWFMYGGNYKPPYDTHCAPSLLKTFIDMLLFKTTDEETEPCNVHMYFAQDLYQSVLIFVAIVCVPVLALGKPLIIHSQRAKLQRVRDAESKRAISRNTFVLGIEYRDDVVHQMPISKNQVLITQTELEEVWLHQGIYCIESILGSISHTASYLRLWALSLAHDQLASVLWDFVLDLGLKCDFGWWNSIILYFAFALWATLTVVILIAMEGLSTFLHTLRLHWVEFQSKFYDGNGQRFLPFRFERSRSTNK